MVIPLSNIKPGESVRMVLLGNEELMAGRLRDLGFEDGAVVSCVLRRSKGNIAAYLVRNAVIALREEDSRLMLVEPCDMNLNSRYTRVSLTGTEIPGCQSTETAAAWETHL